MPSVITHDTFGREIYSDLNRIIGQSEDEKLAFLLGCQGPDVFFYGLLNPLTQKANSIASKLHRYDSAEMIACLALSVNYVREEVKGDTEEERRQRLDKAVTIPEIKKAYRPAAAEIARAYALGYLMHHELDSKVHPFVFMQQFLYCDAGIPGLDRDSQSEVHVEIERDFDEMVLTVKRGESISTFDPSIRTLESTPFVSEVINKMYEFALPIVKKIEPQPHLYSTCVKCYRQLLRWLYSTTGIKRSVLGRMETIFRKNSFLQAMAYKNVKITESIYDNHEHNEWANPWTGEKTTDGFWDLYDRAVKKGKKHTKKFAETIDSLETIDDEKDKLRAIYACALSITKGLNFYGCPEEIADPKTGRTKGN